MLLHARLLHAVQRLDVHGAAAAALVAVGASASAAREAHEVAGGGEASLDGPGGSHQCGRRARNCKAAGRRTRCSCDSQCSFARRDQDPAPAAPAASAPATASAPEAAASAALAKPSAASASAIWLWVKASMSWMAPCFLQGRALPCALKQGLHLGRPPYDLWWGHLVWRRGQAVGVLGMHSVRSTAQAADRGPFSVQPQARYGGLRCLDARLP